jgi:hypothetical protein
MAKRMKKCPRPGCGAYVQVLEIDGILRWGVHRRPDGKWCMRQ